MNGNGQKKLPAGSRTNTGLALFSKRARTWVLSAALILIVCFILIPVCLDRLSLANGLSVPASVLLAETPAPTHAPVVFSTAEVALPPDQARQSGAEPLISQYSLLQENDDFPAVQLLQLRLIELGYLDSDEPSTKYNDPTRAAVSLFQRTCQYEITGVADVALQERLYSAEAKPYEMKIGDNGADVRTMQSRLSELGYYDSKINGFFGSATEDAVKAFQKKNKLEISGIFSVVDRDVLYSPSALPKIDPTPTPSPTPKRTPSPTRKPSNTQASGGSTGSDTPPQTQKPTETQPTGGSYTASKSVSGLISVAKAKLGCRYEWSEEGPNTFDCSGLVYFCLRECGVSTSRYSASGFSEVSRWSRISSIGDLKAGDLLFFRNDESSRISHTGIFIGSGKFIHASSSSGKVITSSISSSYWTRNFMLARRVF